VSTYKRGGVYWYEFEFKGQRVRESTHQGNDKVARTMEGAHRARLAELEKAKDAAKERLGCDEVLTCHKCEELFNAAKAVRREDGVFCGIQCARSWGKSRSMPTLKSFLDDRFIPDVEVTHKAKAKTVRYYKQGAAMLKKSSFADLRLDELTGEHSGKFAAEFKHLSPSGINMGLRTLRRALNLAFQWGVIEKPVRVELAKGENQRDRALTEEELNPYLEACPQPWKDAATIISEEGMRPGETFVMRWEYLFLGEDGTGLIRVVDGKSRAAKRIIPMTPKVHALLWARWIEQDKPAEGWVLPTDAKCGHLEEQTAKRQHAVAMAAVQESHDVQPFVPYVLRHTALTRLAKAAKGDVFALAKIAGHSSITITQKYVHPEMETVDQVFSRLADGKKASVGAGKSSRVPTKSPTPKRKAAKVLMAASTN